MGKTVGVNVTWDGVTKTGTLSPDEDKARDDIAYAARAYDWQRLLVLLAEDTSRVNAIRPGGSSWYTPLHQAAHGCAPADVCGRLIEMGALRSIRNAQGERPVDVAKRRGHDNLIGMLTPPRTRDVDRAALGRLEAHLHDVIRSRAGHLVAQHALRLPQLEALLEVEPPEMWFPVPGVHGGFHCRLDDSPGRLSLTVDSWSRVLEGSGERHVVTVDGSKLVDQGFV